MNHAHEQMWRTVRYALASNSRTARLCVLMMIAVIIWQVMF